MIIAEAEKEGEIMRGEGDAQAIRIFADAFGQDVDFFTFYRSMQAYRDALGDDTTSFVLSPDSEFFRFFNDPDAALQTAGAARASDGAPATAPREPRRCRAPPSGSTEPRPRPRSSEPAGAPAAPPAVGHAARTRGAAPLRAAADEAARGRRAGGRRARAWLAPAIC